MAFGLLMLMSSVTAVPLPYHYAHPGRLNHRVFRSNPDWQRRTLALVAAAEQAVPLYRAIPGETGVVSPGDFGGDPTGKTDSSTAFAQSIAKLLTLGGGRKNGANQTDLGGATLQLSGGVWAVSEPVAIPAGYANYRIEGGTIIAHPTFNTGEGRYLLALGGVCSGSTAGLSKNCATDISLSEVTLDGRDRAWGGVKFQSAVNVNVGPAVMVFGFQGIGIDLNGVGAGYIHDSWAGQYEAGDPRPRNHANATVILMDGGEHDCDLTNVIIFSGRVGVNSTNGANRLLGVHTWNLAGSAGGTGILLNGGSGRVQDCYLDYAPLVIHSPNNVQVTGCLFLGSSTIVLASGRLWPKSPKINTAITNVIITSNIWHTGNTANATMVVDETLGKFLSIADTVVEGNQVQPSKFKGKKLGTRATRSAAVPANESTVTLDFSEDLVLGSVGIAEARCYLSCGGSGGCPQGATKPPFPTMLAQVIPGTPSVRVDIDKTTAELTVTCDVDQSQRTCAAH